jgi:hypothetical protein
VRAAELARQAELEVVTGDGLVEGGPLELGARLRVEVDEIEAIARRAAAVARGGYTIGIAVAVLVVGLGFYLNLGVGILLVVVVGVGAVFVGVVIATRTAVASAVLVLETQPLDPALPTGEQRRVPVVAALRRSWHLVKGRTPRTLGILLVANLVASVVSSVIQTAFTLLATGIGLGIGDSFVGTEAVTLVVLGIGALASSVLQIAFLSAVNALVYVDARMRSEGLDITLAQVTSTGSTGAGAAGAPIGGLGAAAVSPWATR